MPESSMGRFETSGVGGLPGVPCPRCGNHHRGDCRPRPLSEDAKIAIEAQMMGGDLIWGPWARKDDDDA